jgi:hypothetical protein
MTKSLILSYTGTLDSALRSCDSALYLLFRGASAIKKKNNERSESTGSSTDPFGATTESKPDSQYASAFAGNIAFRESQWAIAQVLLKEGKKQENRQECVY